MDVRLLDINSPERNECFHRESANYLIETLRGRSVTLQTDDELDQYGRVLAYVWDQDRNVNLDLVRRGLAIATTPGTGGGFLLDEEEAFAAGTGLWAPDACGTGSIPEIRIVALDEDKETIVIRNETNSVVDLSKWSIRDESSRHRYRFPNQVRLDGGAEVIISSDDQGWDPGGSPVWNNDGDMALLLDPSGRVVDRWRY